MKKVDIKFNFLDRVELIGSEGESYYVSKMCIDASGDVEYGLLKSGGGYLWMKSHELVKINKDNPIGFKLLLENINGNKEKEE